MSMSTPVSKKVSIGSVLSVIGDLPDRLSGRLRKKIVNFDRRISAFRQRRWS